METEITLQQVLAAREYRVSRQQALTEQFGRPLICFTMNIAGPVKNGPVIRRAFEEGLNRLADTLQTARIPVLHREEIDEATGCEAFWVADGDARAIKSLCAQLEDEDALGRLFDIDVLSPNGAKLDREELGYAPRPCLVCGKPGKGCASRRVHPVEEVQAATQKILREYFAAKDSDAIAETAVRALLYEVCTTPKPGLVDRTNTGSHRDMDIFTFMDSTAALIPYFRKAAAIGQAGAERSHRETFALLRRAGLAAERVMFAATKGINTHKGAIFSLGIVCCAAGRLWSPEQPWADTESILAECARLSKEAVENDFAAIREPVTKGQRLYTEQGLKGIRGELAEGLPDVESIGLPALKAALAAEASLEQAGAAALIQLIAQVADTSLIARGGVDNWRWAAESAAEVQGPIPSQADLKALDRAFTQKNLSPGGCADLLAITYFLHFAEEKGGNHHGVE